MEYIREQEELFAAGKWKNYTKYNIPPPGSDDIIQEWQHQCGKESNISRGWGTYMISQVAHFSKQALGFSDTITGGCRKFEEISVTSF